MHKLRIGQFRAKPAKRHPQFAAQEELKIEPTVLL